MHLKVYSVGLFLPLTVLTSGNKDSGIPIFSTMALIPIPPVRFRGSGGLRGWYSGFHLRTDCEILTHLLFFPPFASSSLFPPFVAP